MYKIEKTDYGVRLTFAGRVDAHEMTRWLEESEDVLPGLKRGFCVFVDMRTLIPLTPDTEHLIKEGQKLYKRMGMERSVVILASPVITMQFKGIAHETGIYKWERYIDASSEPNWEQVGLDWLTREIDPDTFVSKSRSTINRN